MLANRCGKREGDRIYFGRGGRESSKRIKEDETGMDSRKSSLAGAGNEDVGHCGVGGKYWQNSVRENPAFCGQSDFGHTSMHSVLIYFTRAICSMALVAVGWNGVNGEKGSNFQISIIICYVGGSTARLHAGGSLTTTRDDYGLLGITRPS